MTGFDDELMDEWNEVLQDDDLFDMIVNNLLFSQLENSQLEEVHVSDDSREVEVPRPVLETVEAMNLNDSWYLSCVFSFCKGCS